MKPFLILIFFTTLSFGQKVEYYNYGYEGMERYGKWKDSTLIYSNYKAKPTIRVEVCDSIIKRYLFKKPLPKDLVLRIKNATVFGKFQLTRKDKLIHLEFFYEKVIWNDSITEKPKIKVALKKKK